MWVSVAVAGVMPAPPRPAAPDICVLSDAVEDESDMPPPSPLPPPVPPPVAPPAPPPPPWPAGVIETAAVLDATDDPLSVRVIDGAGASAGVVAPLLPLPAAATPPLPADEDEDEGLSRSSNISSASYSTS